MPDATLQDLTRRVEALEKKLATPPAPDWRSVVGMFDDDPEFQEVIAEGIAIREAARKGDEIVTCFVVDGCP